MAGQLLQQLFLSCLDNLLHSITYTGIDCSKEFCFNGVEECDIKILINSYYSV